MLFINKFYTLQFTISFNNGNQKCFSTRILFLAYNLYFTSFCICIKFNQKASFSPMPQRSDGNYWAEAFSHE